MEQSKPSLLEELNKTVQMSLEVTNIILPKIEDNALREVVLNQRKHYEELIEKINELCTARKLKVTVPKFDSMMLWGSIQMHTLKDSSPEHIAELMVNGTNMAIVDMIKTVNDAENEEPNTKKLAQSYIDQEEKNLEELKKHL